MKRNLIVIGGVLVLILTGYFFPVLSFPEKKWYMPTMETMSLTSSTSMGVGLVILWFMQSNSKWRGVLWIFLSVVGPILNVTEVQNDYNFFINRGLKVDPNYVSGKPSYEIGLYLILFGYLIVIIGSVWDIVQKRRAEQINLIPNQIVIQANAE